MDSIARVVFSNNLLRVDADAPELRREEVQWFIRSLFRTMNICTTQNIKACKDFIVRFITPSTARTVTLGKFLLDLSKTCSPKGTGLLVEGQKAAEDNEGLGRTRDGNLMQPPDAAFKRLHLLYIVHDVLLFLAVTSREPQHSRYLRCNDSALETLKTHGLLLAQLASCSEQRSRAGRATLEPVRAILGYWQKHQILEAGTCSKIEAKCETASNTSWKDLQRILVAEEYQATLDEQRRREEATKWILPMQHQLPHDTGALWHELPAANGLFQKRTQGYPLRAHELPQGGYRLKNGGQQADEAMKAEVAELRNEALRCFDKYTNADEVRDIDALGNIVWKTRPTRNFWGFEIKS